MTLFAREFRKSLILMLATATSLLAEAASVHVDPLAAWPVDGVALATRPVGRVEPQAGARGWRHQWPGTYFEARFAGSTVDIDLGTGEKHARVSIDGREVADLVRPGSHLFRIRALAPGDHVIRVDIVSESRDGVQMFGGFAVPAGAELPAPRARARAIEFIGDSWTVGYGAASRGRTCSEDEVWRRTDNSLAFGSRVARELDADFRILAISGRGMVRNYANGAGDPLPAAYERQLPADTAAAVDADDPAWAPQLVVIGLGTNDFSTPVAAGEPWKDAADLAAAFESRYVDFVHDLHRRRPSARFLLLASDAGDGAAERAIRRVRARLASDGVPVGEVLALGPLALDGCNWHPSSADQASIARQVATAVDALMPDWRPSPP